MEEYLEAKPLVDFVYHKPVLLREVVEALNMQDGEWYLDCTLGDGGHSLEILKRGGRIVGIDVDPQAIDRARERLVSLGYLGKFVLIQGNFRELENLINKQADLADQKFAGVIFDLGVSSLQLMSPERGFSFVKEGPLDMRMDPQLTVRALDLVNGLNKGELYELFSKLGEEKFAKALAAACISARQVRTDSRFAERNYSSRSSNLAFRPRRNVRPIQSTRDLAEIVEKVMGSRGKIHPATRIFQALRIAVNDELNALREVLPQACKIIKNNGYIVVISFHSLEDRIVKDNFRQWQIQGLGKVVTKKPIIPSELELTENPRSRSAKLRIFEVIKNDHNQEIRSRRTDKKIS